jgi:hypothetical protein
LPKGFPSALATYSRRYIQIVIFHIAPFCILAEE